MWLLHKYKYHIKCPICFREVQAKNEVTNIIAHCYGNNRDRIIHYVQWEAVSVALKWFRFSAIATNWARTKSLLSNHKETWYTSRHARFRCFSCKLLVPFARKLARQLVIAWNVCTFWGGRIDKRFYPPSVDGGCKKVLFILPLFYF